MCAFVIYSILYLILCFIIYNLWVSSYAGNTIWHPQTTRYDIPISACCYYKITSKSSFKLADYFECGCLSGNHFGVNLLHRKSEVKAIITEVINNMSDDEDEDADASGDESGKDGGDDEA